MITIFRMFVATVICAAILIVEVILDASFWSAVVTTALWLCSVRGLWVMEQEQDPFPPLEPPPQPERRIIPVVRVRPENDHITEHGLSGYIRKTLSPADLERVDNHLYLCEQCWHEYWEHPSRIENEYAK